MIRQRLFTSHIIEILLLFFVTSVPVFSTRHHVDPLINNLRVPAEVVTGDSAPLGCEFDLGDETLYQVKWYKDTIEFFRYNPRDRSPMMFFPIAGIDVDKSKSDMSTVFLRDLNADSSGNYTCQVSTDAPYFNEVETTKHLKVIGARRRIRPGINKLHIPSEVYTGDSGILRCEFELGNETLYAVKWYKDKVEFFRYMPESYPQLKTWPLLGIDVDISKSDMNAVFLRNLNDDSSGNYTCEVSTDKPYFRCVEKTEQLEVVGVQPTESSIIIFVLALLTITNIL